jgi:hypothetical protein
MKPKIKAHLAKMLKINVMAISEQKPLVINGKIWWSRKFVDVIVNSIFESKSSQLNLRHIPCYEKSTFKHGI